MPTFIEDEDESERVGRNDQTHSGSVPSNNGANEEEKTLGNESPNKLLDSRLRDYPGQTTPVVLESVINQRR